MTNTYFNLKQGDRVELKYDFDRGRFEAGHRGTVHRVVNWLGKNHVKVSVLFDGDNAAYEFSPITGRIQLTTRESLSETDCLKMHSQHSTTPSRGWGCWSGWWVRSLRNWRQRNARSYQAAK